MEPRAWILVLCLLCVARASVPPPEEIAEVGKGSLARVQDLSIIAVQAAGNGSDDGADKSRDKRALGLLLSGLAQIFGYTVTPIQLASLPNPNTTAGMMPPPMMPPPMMAGGGQQKAPSQPAAMNVTMAPRRQETIRFTGVVNFGNNSDIIGHLQRYEQIFHGRGNASAMTTAAMMTTPRPTPSGPPAPSKPPAPPGPPTKFLLDLPITDAETKPPLLAPFFVKIPLPIAPELLATTLPVQDLQLSYPVSPLVSVVSETSEEAPPVRKEQETVYRNSENTERYTVEQKDIYDERDVHKPASKYTHQLYVNDPRWQKQQEDRYNEVQREQEGHVARLKEQEDERERSRDSQHREVNEINERQRHREQQIAHHNRERVTKYEPTKGRRPVVVDEDDIEEVDEESTRNNQEERAGPVKDERGKTGDYADYDDRVDANEQSSEQERPEEPPPADPKYVEVGYNQQLPIGDYFHEGNPEQIRDSYGEVLDNKKLKDDRLSGYFSMFKHPHTNGFDSQEVRDAEDSSREDDGTEASSAKAYDEHLTRVEKLREEYALPAPQNKYEEYDLNDESEVDRGDKQSETAKNHAPASRPTKPKTEGVRSKERTRAKPTTTTGSSRNRLRPIDDVKSADAKPSRQEIDIAQYAPLIVPVRYIDVDTDKTAEQTTTRRLKYKKPDGGPANDRIAEDNTATVKLTAQIASAARPRQLHEEGEQAEHKNFQIWPPPFDYAFDNTEQTNTVLPPATHNYHPNHYQPIVTNVATNDASESSEEPTGYLVVVGNSADPYQYPHNVYYFPNEAVRPQSPDSQPNTEGTHPQQQLYAPRVNADRQPVRVYPNLTEYGRNETANDRNLHGDYYRSRESPVLDRYGYIFGERSPRASKQPGEEVRGQIFNTDNWSSKIYHSPPVPLRNLVTSPNQYAQSGSSDGQLDSRQPSRRRKSSLTEPPDDERRAMTPPQRSSPKRKLFDDPQSAHDFFGFSKNDYSFDGESGASKVAEASGGNARRDSMRVPVAPEPSAIAYRHDESLAEQADEPENDPEKAKVTEYRNKVATLRVSEQRRLTPNGPIHYVDFEKKEEIQRRNELENRMTEILEDLKTRLLVE